jgi:hypothetical protein
MVVLRDARFEDEAARFQLRFTCEDCGYFDEARERCKHDWPTKLHRRARYQGPPAPSDEVVFCKEFELR